MNPFHAASAGLFALVACASLAGEPPRATPEPAPPGLPFQRYTTTDALGRTVTFYLSPPPPGAPEARLPVVLLIQGSGCQSLFRRPGERVLGGLQNVLLAEAKGRARVLAVEKPGVKFLDVPPRPGAALGASGEFLREHTLPRWAEANRAALRAAWALPGVDGRRALLIGHSEGGIVAARVAAEEPRVTHVASLAGGGPTQLFSLAELQGRPRPGDTPGEAARRRQQVFDEWAKIRADPDSTTKFWMGHPYRRWSSFLPHSLTEELLRSKARVYLVHGTEDTSEAVASFDVARAELAARGRDVTAERLEGADHGFRTADMPAGSPDGLKAAFGRVLKWFLADQAPAE
jgi:pimeloyl-ACP methyl ester carboxylesterase